MSPDVERERRAVAWRVVDSNGFTRLFDIRDSTVMAFETKELATEWAVEGDRVEPLYDEAALRALAQRIQREAVQECADYVRQCGTASHPVGYGDWCGGEVDPIKLLTGIADVLDRRAAEEDPGAE